MPKKLLPLLLLGSFFFFWSKPTNAELQSCYSTLTPTTTYTNSEQRFSVFIEGQGEEPIQWVQLEIPETFTYVSAQSSGWTAQLSEDRYINFTGGTLQPYTNHEFIVTLRTPATPDGPFNMSSSASDDPTGYVNLGCDNTSGITVLDGSTTVQLGSISISGLSATQAVLSFTTNIPATSQLNYGTTTSYGSTLTQDSAGTSHQFSLSNLTPNTTYNLQISASNGTTTANSGNVTFTTAISSAQITPTIIYISPTQGPTPTPIVRILPTPTPLPDTQKPVITVQSLPATRLNTAPVISGTVIDNGVISAVEYSLDGGRSWNRIRTVSGLHTNTANFSFTPEEQLLPQNDTVTLRIRSRDLANNSATSEAISFTLDRSGPTVQLTTAITKPFTAAPVITGTANDPAGEVNVAYAIRKAQSPPCTGAAARCTEESTVVSWFQPVDRTAVTADTTAFTTQLPPLDDGNYILQIKATDQLGNETIQNFEPFIIDRLPPGFGTYILRSGPLILEPHTNGIYILPKGKEMDINISLVGGPDRVTLTNQSNSFSMNYNSRTNLWQTTLVFWETGIKTITATASDGAGNITTSELITLYIIPSGSITNDKNELIESTVELFYNDPETGRFVPWEGAAYQQRNLQRVTENNPLSWFLPPGRYSLVINPKTNDYLPAQTTLFSVTAPQVITPQVVLQRNTTVPVLRSLLPFIHRTILPWTPQIAYANISLPKPEEPLNLRLLPQNTVLQPYLGLPITLYYANTWHPYVVNQLAAHSDSAETVIVFPHETQPSVDVFKERGGYSVPMLADPDGVLLETFPFQSFTTQYRISADGNSNADF